MRTLRWVAPIAVLAVAALLRFWALGRPGELVFDELYYVRDAISQLTHGFPTVWPDDDPSMTGERAGWYTDEPSNAVHPPLGKWVIALGVLIFGPESAWGWRSASAFCGVATVALTMRLGFLLTRSHQIAWLAGFVLAIDGVHVTLSRVGLLDGILTFFVVLGTLFIWRDVEQCRRDEAAAHGRTLIWARPWLLAAALTFGAAAGVKWSGLYPLAFFLVLISLRDAANRVRHSSPRPLLHAALQACITAAIALPAAALAYLASWAGWILHPGGWGRQPGEPWLPSLVQYHGEMLAWHSTLSAPHPYQAHPLSWPLALKPTAMYEVAWSAAEGCPWSACVSGITPLPNPLITWAGVACLLALAALAFYVWRAGAARAELGERRSVRVDRVGRRDPIDRLVPLAPAHPLIMTGTLIVAGYLSGWLPWVLTFSRSAVFQFYAVVLTPFSALALAVVLGLLCGFAVRGDAAGGIFAEGGSSAGGGAGHGDAVQGGPTGGGVHGTAPRGDAALGIAPGEVTFSSGLGDPSPEAVRGRRLSVACFLIVAGLIALLFFPVWSGMPVAEWFWRAHMWLPWWS